jgi:hypothetical protein
MTLITGTMVACSSPNEVGVEHRVALVAAELLEPGRANVAVHAGAERATPKGVTAQQLGIEAGLDDLRDDARLPTRGRGVLRQSRPRGEVRIRWNTAPAVIPVTSSQDRGHGSGTARSCRTAARRQSPSAAAHGRAGRRGRFRSAPGDLAQDIRVAASFLHGRWPASATARCMPPWFR